MRDIIVPLDGSTHAEQALRAAFAVAERSGAGVTVIRVQVRSDTEDCHAYLEGAVARFGDVAATSIRVATGTPADAILHSVPTDDSLICMATHGRGGIGRLVLGSVAEEVVRRSTTPILLVGPHGAAMPLRDEHAHMIVCTDCSEISDKIVTVAASFAHDLALSCSVVNVVGPDEDVALDLGPPPRPRLAHAESDCARCCDRLLADGVDTIAIVLHGDAPRAIQHHARTSHAAFIALATHGRSGMARYTLGSTAADIVRGAPCPVLVINTLARSTPAPDTDGSLP